MHAFRLIWMAFSGFFAWFAGLPLVPASQGGLGLQHTLPLPGMPLAACAACAAVVRPTSFNITA